MAGATGDEHGADEHAADASGGKARPRVYLSHSPRDNAFAERLAADLRAAGADVGVDLAESEGEAFHEQLDASLATRDWLVFVLTAAALESPRVRLEVNSALYLVWQKRIHAVIPVVAADFDPFRVPPTWSTLHYYDARRDYPGALSGLLAALGLSGAPDVKAQAQLQQVGPTRARLARRRLLQFGAAGATAALIGGSAGATWLLTRGSATAGRTATTTPTVPLGPTSTPQTVTVRLRWRVECDQAIVSPPLVAAGMVCVGTAPEPGRESVIEGFATADGTKKWTQQLTGGGWDPILAGSTLYSVTTTSTSGPTTTYLYALNPADGTIRWQRQLPQGYASYITGIDTYISIIDAYGNLDVLSLTDGTELRQLPGSPYAQWNELDGAAYRMTPSGSGSSLAAFDPGSGAARWTKTIASTAQNTVFAASGGILYVAGSTTASGSISAIQASSGSVAWSAGIAKGYVPAVLAVAEGTIFAVLTATKAPTIVAAWQVSNGTTLWAVPLDSSVGAPLRILVGNGIACVAADSLLATFDAHTGASKWVLNVNGGDTATLVPSGVLYMDTGVDFLALDATSGQLLWRYPSYGGTSPPVVVDGAIYVADGSGAADGNGILYSLNV